VYHINRQHTLYVIFRKSQLNRKIEMLKKIKTFMNHERYQTISVAVVLILLAVIYGCESKVKSILYPDIRITRPQLEIEVNTFLAEAEIRAEQLNIQDELKETIYKVGMTTAQSGTLNPIGVITSMASILGIGAVADNVRRRRDLKKWESGKLKP